MITVGELLKKRRLEKKLTYEEIEKATRIRAKFLEKLEENDYQALPPATFVKGFIRNYGQFLGLDPARLLAIYRRQFNEKINKVFFEKKEENPRFTITPNIVLALFISLIISVFLFYLFNEYKIYKSAPVIVISSPDEFQVIPKNSVEVKGRTQPETVLSINGQKIEIAQDGSFSQEISLLPGTNTITIQATNKFGKTTEIKRSVKSQQ